MSQIYFLKITQMANKATIFGNVHAQLKLGNKVSRQSISPRIKIVLITINEAIFIKNSILFSIVFVMFIFKIFTIFNFLRINRDI